MVLTLCNNLSRRSVCLKCVKFRILRFDLQNVDGVGRFSDSGGVEVLSISLNYIFEVLCEICRNSSVKID